MTIPTWEKFMIPVLQNSNEEIKVLDLADICAKKFNLTEQEMDLGYDKNPGKKYRARTWWAVTYMYQARLLDKVRRGVVKITDRGKKVLELNKCNDDWCLIADKEIKGWVMKKGIWGY